VQGFYRQLVDEREKNEFHHSFFFITSFCNY